MGQQTVKGEDGRDYVELPGGVRFPADELKEPAMQPGEQFGRGVGRAGVAQAMFEKVATPEVLGGVASMLGPETGGLSLAIPPLVGAGTSLVRDYMRGEKNPATYAGNAGIHAFTNFAPSIVKGLWPSNMGSALTRAVDAAATDSGSWVSTAAKGLKAALSGSAADVADPAAAAAAKGGSTAMIYKLQQKLTDPALNSTARAAVITAIKKLESQLPQQVSQGLRAFLGAGSVVHQAGQQ